MTLEPAGGLAIEDLEVRYPGRREPALSGVSITVKPGDLVGVTGRTGSGSSTLALVAAGFVPRVVRARISGTATVDGLDLTAATAGELAGRVGIVFSTPANQLSASKLTVREELAFGLENLGVPRAEMDGRIDATLARLRISHLADREPLALSGGEQQRVAIASIVVMGPGTLIVDQPTAQLDPSGTRSVAELLASEAAAGRAVLAIEQDPVVLGRTDRCLVLEAGRPVSFDVPGRALGTTVLTPIGLRAPSVVRLAELAGLPSERAFDEAAIADALMSRHATPDVAADAAPGPPAGPSITWLPTDPPTGSAIAVREVTFSYPTGAPALRGVDIAIAPGETVAIIGQNGSGKTTLAKHLNGLLRPASGTVEIGGRDIREVRVHRLAATVGFVFQDPDDQLFNRSVEREVAFGPRNLGITGPALAGRVDRALELTGLAAVRGDNPYDLGLSTRKLVALTSVIAMEPDILLLDEPTTGQDGPGAARIGAIVDACAATGRTVVAISHDMEFAAAHFGRIVVMRAGTIVADGSPTEIFAPELSSLLASTGLEPPLAARIGARLGLGSTPTETVLLAAIRATYGAEGR